MVEREFVSINNAKQIALNVRVQIFANISVFAHSAKNVMVLVFVLMNAYNRIVHTVKVVPYVNIILSRHVV